MENVREETLRRMVSCKAMRKLFSSELNVVAENSGTGFRRGLEAGANA